MLGNTPISAMPVDAADTSNQFSFKVGCKCCSTQCNIVLCVALCPRQEPPFGTNSPFEGVDVTVRDLEGNVVGQGTTAASGCVTFNNVPSGSYDVTATPPAGVGCTQRMSLVCEQQGFNENINFYKFGIMGCNGLLVEDWPAEFTFGGAFVGGPYTTNADGFTDPICITVNRILWFSIDVHVTSQRFLDLDATLDQNFEPPVSGQFSGCPSFFMDPADGYTCACVAPLSPDTCDEYPCCAIPVCNTLAFTSSLFGAGTLTLGGDPGAPDAWFATLTGSYPAVGDCCPGGSFRVDYYWWPSLDGCRVVGRSIWGDFVDCAGGWPNPKTNLCPGTTVIAGALAFHRSVTSLFFQCRPLVAGSFTMGPPMNLTVACESLPGGDCHCAFVGGGDTSCINSALNDHIGDVEIITFSDICVP